MAEMEQAFFEIGDHLKFRGYHGVLVDIEGSKEQLIDDLNNTDKEPFERHMVYYTIELNDDSPKKIEDDLLGNIMSKSWFKNDKQYFSDYFYVFERDIQKIREQKINELLD